MEGHNSTSASHSNVRSCQRKPGRTVDFSQKKPPQRLHNNSVGGQKTLGRNCGTSESTPVISQVRTIQIPKSMKDAAFLKHPDLTMGQKRYLCSIAKIYSTSNMRAILENQLQSQIRCGSRKAHLNHKTSGNLKDGTKDHCTRSQMNHWETKGKSCIAGIEDNISGMEETSIMEDTQQATAISADSVLTIEETTSQWMESLSVNDDNCDQ
ncbi:protein FAM216A [Aquarana catesbeiana]|uniref:protein FAM216A n=1 Tax=Aquarana catesbeiana TaxID=8400 RepID=UPI003CC957C3